MRLSGFGWVHSMNSSLRLCLCLVLVCLITTGATGCTAPSSTSGKLPAVQVCKAEPLELNDGDSAQSSTGGKLPDIKVFKAEPLELNDGDSALYTFVVKRATKIQVIEAGNSIKEINNPSLATLKGTVTGLSAYAIQTGDSGTFITVLMASNEGGSVKEELTLSFAANLMPAGLPAGQSGATDNQTEPRSPKWLAQFSSPVPSMPSTTLRSAPEFFKCPSDCAYCLKPDEAASHGFTKKCSEERCYYSPDDQQNWYCYSEPEGWCCANGKVNQTTQAQCAQVGGAWSTNQAEAMERCQPMGYCCRDGQVGQTTQAQCAQVGGAWYTNQAQAIERCRQPATCWCCTGGKVYQTTQAQCAQTGGTCYATQSQATAGCRQAAMCWCCSGGKVSYTTQAACAQVGGACYSTQTEATRACQPPIRTPTLK